MVVPTTVLAAVDMVDDDMVCYFGRGDQTDRMPKM